MKYSLKLERNGGYKWKEIENICFKGIIYDKNHNRLTAKEIHALFKPCKNKGDFKSKVENISGIFAIIMCNHNEIYIASDIIRTFPLFLYKQQDEWVITDNLERHIDVCDYELNYDAYNEFVSSGFVSGCKTMVSDITQLQSAEVIKIIDTNIEREFYWTYATESYKNKSFNDLCEELVAKYEIVVNKLIAAVKNKTIVLPLSGGYDSRLIAVLLKKRNFENVICFTYGKKKCFEADISKKVANKLGYKWLFIEYSDELILEHLKKDGNWDKYSKYSSNFVSIPHISDFIAVTEMKKKNLIPNNSVFVPGHSGDIFAGTHIPKNIESIANKEEIMKAILGKHFRFTENDISINVETNNKKLHSVFEEYSWKERQTKFIINSVRCYEYYDYKYLIPLWDKDLANFFKKVNIDYKNRYSLTSYKEVNNLYDYVATNLFKDYDVYIKKSFFNNLIHRILCKLFGYCKNKDCLNYYTIRKTLDPTASSSQHINESIVKNTLRILRLE